MKHKYSIIFALVLLLLSCRTAEQLVDKAIRKDPTILVGKTDTVTLSHFIIDSIPVVKNDTIVWEKVTVEVKYDTIIRSSQIFIERKKTRLEIRKAYQLQKKVAHYKSKIDRLEAKLKARTDRVEVRNETKKERIRSRWWLWYLLGFATPVTLWIIRKIYRI